MTMQKRTHTPDDVREALKNACERQAAAERKAKEDEARKAAIETALEPIVLSDKTAEDYIDEARIEELRRQANIRTEPQKNGTSSLEEAHKALDMLN